MGMRVLRGFFKLLLYLTLMGLSFLFGMYFLGGLGEDEGNKPPTYRSAQGEQDSANKGYQYVDFTGVDWEAVLPVQPEDSLLGRPGYAYSLLSEEDRRLYEEMYYAVLNFEELYRLSSTDVDRIKKVRGYVDAVHPELFWSSGYSLHKTTR